MGVKGKEEEGKDGGKGEEEEEKGRKAFFHFHFISLYSDFQNRLTS